MVSSTIVDLVKPDLSVLRLELLVVLEVSPLAQVRRRSVLVEVQVVLVASVAVAVQVDSAP